MSWFKLHNDIIHDPKIRALAYEDRWHFVALMCLMNDGTLDEPEAIREELVEVCLGLHGVDLASLKKRLVRLRLIDQNWTPVNWGKRQESKDKTAAARMRKYRESLKKSESDGDVTRNITEKLRTEVRSKKKEVRSKNIKHSATVQGQSREIDVTNFPALANSKTPDHYVQFAEQMWAKVKTLSNQTKDPNFAQWADDIRKLVELDGQPLDLVSQIFHWANSDDFWAANVLSPAKLRKNFPRLFAQCKGSAPQDFGKMAREAQLLQ